MKEYTQIGMTAFRDRITGEFDTPIPLYVETKYLGETDDEGVSLAERKMLMELGRILAKAFKAQVVNQKCRLKQQTAIS